MMTRCPAGVKPQCVTRRPEPFAAQPWRRVVSARIRVIDVHLGSDDETPVEQRAHRPDGPLCRTDLR